MAYHPVPMLTINKLTNALKSIANCLDETKVPNTLADAKYSMMIAEMIARRTLDDTAAEIHSIKPESRWRSSAFERFLKL